MRLNGTRLKYTIDTAPVAEAAHLRNCGVLAGRAARTISDLERSKGSGVRAGEPPCQ